MHLGCCGKKWVGKPFSQPGSSWIPTLSWPSLGWEDQNLGFFWKENPIHIFRRASWHKAVFFDCVSLLLYYFMHVFYNNWAKTSEGKGSFPFKNVRCDGPPNQKFKLVLKKEIILLNLFFGWFGGVGIRFVGRCLSHPKCKTAHSLQSSSSGQHLLISSSSPRGRLFLCRCFVPRTLIFACMHKRKN